MSSSDTHGSELDTLAIGGSRGSMDTHIHPAKAAKRRSTINLQRDPCLAAKRRLEVNRACAKRWYYHSKSRVQSMKEEVESLKLHLAVMLERSAASAPSGTHLRLSALNQEHAALLEQRSQLMKTLAGYQHLQRELGTTIESELLNWTQPPSPS